MIVRCGIERPSCEEQNERYQGEARAARIGPERESRGVGSRADSVRADGGSRKAGARARAGCRSTAKLSEIGVKTAADASRPIVTRFGSGWKAMHFG